MSDYKDIWDAGGELSEEQLTAYLEGRLSPEEAHALEAMLSNDSADSDAVEGLAALGAEDAAAMKRKLNAGLQQAMHKKRRTRRGMAAQRWTWLAIGIILLLAVLSYAVMWLMKHPVPH